MSKKFQLVNVDVQGPATSCTAKTDWKLCVICQEHTSEVLRCPLQNSQVDKGSGYTSLAEHLIQLKELGQLPSTLPIDWMRVTVLKQLWSTMKWGWTEQKSEHAVNVRLINSQNANLEGHNQVGLLKWHRRTSVSSADSLVAMKAFIPEVYAACPWPWSSRPSKLAFLSRL